MSVEISSRRPPLSLSLLLLVAVCALALQPVVQCETPSIDFESENGANRLPWEESLPTEKRDSFGKCLLDCYKRKEISFQHCKLRCNSVF
ncbi:hypothetical protein BOX15_Mlig008733g1 [Macrostomum lignano]|nr:hypothetical protein BOX15_Mlig008733g1 [Macrostomum lignano]